MSTKKIKPVKSLTLPPLRWVVIANGKRYVHKFPNPLERIINTFNERNAKYGAVASLD